MSLRIPPVIQFLICGLLMWGIAMLLPALDLSLRLFEYAGSVLIAAGVMLLIVALIAFVRARTTVNPVEPEQAKTLVTTGLYRISRNPMYLAMALILLGSALRLSNIGAFIAPALFVWWITLFQIKPEERALQSIFGEDFTAYRQQTRRWL